VKFKKLGFSAPLSDVITITSPKEYHNFVSNLSPPNQNSGYTSVRQLVIGRWQLDTKNKMITLLSPGWNILIHKQASTKYNEMENSTSTADLFFHLF